MPIEVCLTVGNAQASLLPPAHQRMTAKRRVLSKSSRKKRRASQMTHAASPQTSAQLSLMTTSPRVVRSKRRLPEADVARSRTPFRSAGRGRRHRVLWKPGFLRMDAAEASPLDIESQSNATARVEVGLGFSPTLPSTQASGWSRRSRMRRKPLLPEPVSALARAPAQPPATAPRTHGTPTGRAVMEDSLQPAQTPAPAHGLVAGLSTRAFAPNAQPTLEAGEASGDRVAATVAAGSEETAAAASLAGVRHDTRLVASVVVVGIRRAHPPALCHATPRRNSSASHRKRAGEQPAPAAIVTAASKRIRKNKKKKKKKKKKLQLSF
eukprot:NODE_5614_length_1752_cov_6.062769.p2 GENE.NODE_5614_length_1752_cov_6.062769~~NODE_5614_length_1752_cov_6.062769.p2  ORF type:complete len:324 (+),score=61.37 NODE_5614_length_1752_cov_6.062769:743-1714(+)